MLAEEAWEEGEYPEIRDRGAENIQEDATWSWRKGRGSSAPPSLPNSGWLQVRKCVERSVQILDAGNDPLLELSGSNGTSCSHTHLLTGHDSAHRLGLGKFFLQGPPAVLLSA